MAPVFLCFSCCGVSGTISSIRELMVNSLSAVAADIMRVGCARTGDVPEWAYGFVLDMFNVPEVPVDVGIGIARYSNQIAIPVTGGLDSSFLYYLALKEDVPVRTFYIDVKQPYAYKEKVALDELDIPYSTLDGPRGLGHVNYWKHIIPGRNFYILTRIAEEIQGGRLWFGAVDGEMPVSGGDKSKKFLSFTVALLAALPYPVKLETPVASYTKTDLVAEWLKRGFGERELFATVSCFSPGPRHCGACQACLRKWMAFANNGLKLVTEIDISFGCVEYIAKYWRVLAEALADNDFSRYSRRRCEQDLAALDKL